MIGHQGDQHELLLAFLKIFHEAEAFEMKVQSKMISKREKNMIKCSQSGYDFTPKLDCVYKSTVYDCMVGQRQFVTKCSSCLHVSKRYETFKVLEIDVAHTIKEATDKLLESTKYENLECDGCKQKHEASRQANFVKLPDVLFLCITRFKYQNGRYVKNNGEVFIDISLDFAGETFDLVGVGEHLGTIGGGHCLSAIKKKDLLYCLDDDNVRPYRTDTKRLRQNCYVLVYEKKK